MSVLLTMVNHLHYRNISIRGEVVVH